MISRKSWAMNSHEIDGVSGISGIGGAEFGVLGGNSGGAGIEMADAHHDTAEGDEGGGGEAEFFGTEEGGDRDVPSGFELSVGFHYNPAAEVIQDEGLVGFGESEFPGESGVFDRGLGRCSGTAVEAGD